MEFLYFILIGIAAGWLAGQIMKGGGFGLVGDLVVGVIGALLGGWLFGLAGIGAGGLIGAELVVRSANDGYTMLFTTATLAINTTLYLKRLKFDTQADLVPSTMVSNTTNVLCVHPSVPAKTVAEFVALAKKIPGKLNFGVNTPGSTSHLAAEILAQQAKLDVVIIAYTGGGPAMAGLVTGDVDAVLVARPAIQGASTQDLVSEMTDLLSREAEHDDAP